MKTVLLVVALATGATGYIFQPAGGVVRSATPARSPAIDMGFRSRIKKILRRGEEEEKRNKVQELDVESAVEGVAELGEAAGNAALKAIFGEPKSAREKQSEEEDKEEDEETSSASGRDRKRGNAKEAAAEAAPQVAPLPKKVELLAGDGALSDESAVADAVSDGEVSSSSGGPLIPLGIGAVAATVFANSARLSLPACARGWRLESGWAGGGRDGRVFFWGGARSV
jgi:hypothetical protein